MATPFHREMRGPSYGRYILVSGWRGPYGRLLFILVCGLVLSLSVLSLYKTLNPTSPNLYLTHSYQIGTKATPKTTNIQVPQGASTASKMLKRLAQMDRSQYVSDQQYDTWAASACSTTAMTEVMNAYGHYYRIADVLQAEINQSAISSELGLLNLDGIDRTVAQFGFSTDQLSRAPMDRVISVANSGWPIIIDFPPSGDWPSGHILVVVGGDSNNVFLADSSPYNFTTISHQQFLRDWGGFAVVAKPKAQ